MTMPWLTSWPVFLIALLPAQVLAIVVHEAGHVIAARLVGVRVFAWGLGFRKTGIHFRIGQTTFYISRPLSQGLTVHAGGLFANSVRPELVILAGGPLASLAGLVAGLGLWSHGIRSDLLMSWIVMSGAFSVASVIPCTYRVGTISLQSDAKRILDLAVYGCQTISTSSGTNLETLRALTELLQSVGEDRGAGYFRVFTGLVEASLGDFEQAADSIASGDAAAAAEIASSAALLGYARAVVASETDSTNAMDQIESARMQCVADSTAGVLLELTKLHLQHALGEEIGDAIHTLRERVLASGRRDWLCYSSTVLFEIDPPQDLERGCRELLAKHKPFISDAMKVRLLTFATERLATYGEFAQARRIFAEAQRAIQSTASEIRCPITRARFVQRAAAPLQRAIVAAADQGPVFIADAPQPSEAIRRRPIFAYATLLTGFSGLVALAVAVIARNGHGGNANVTVDGGMVTILIAMLFSLIGGLTSILRGESRLRIVLIGFTLVALSIGAAVALQLPTPN